MSANRAKTLDLGVGRDSASLCASTGFYKKRLIDSLLWLLPYNFDFNAPVFRATIAGGVACDRLALAFAIDVNAVSREAPAFEEHLDRVSSSPGQIFVVIRRANRIRVPHGDHDLQLHRFEPRGDHVQLALSIRL